METIASRRYRVVLFETVKHAIKPAPYLTTRYLLKLVHERKKYPFISAVIQNRTYLDDILSGANNITIARNDAPMYWLHERGFSTFCK
ncbi:hypothetical protein TNIN_164921 [Trichonephila inaurata madagascariensis]|uniref:Uncharacterized protein n=1 Tax=Trichonephila inaurata madagascariensis TaxID=2747483 RepID=A0A8X6X8T7_9ARAC|nr:hypothetical protein TNIN_164921 [Trichonephila inaurata madagascariensis]